MSNNKQTKNKINVVEEWISSIRRDVYDGLWSNNKHKKNEYFQKILGQCDSILTTLNATQENSNNK